MYPRLKINDRNPVNLFNKNFHVHCNFFRSNKQNAWINYSGRFLCTYIKDFMKQKLRKKLFYEFTM
jgi:hypothetical protein